MVLDIWNYLIDGYTKDYKKFFVHVGYPKTGTSFLQLEVFPKIREGNRDICIISRENLIGDCFSLDVSDMGAIVRLIKKFYPDAKIILGIREIGGMLVSLYSQYVKEGGHLKQKDFFKQKINMERYNHKRYIGMLYDLFGESNVFVYDFKDFKDDIDSVIFSLCSFIGCDVPSYDKSNRYAVRWNDKQIGLMRMAQRYKWVWNPRFWIDRLGG